MSSNVPRTVLSTGKHKRIRRLIYINTTAAAPPHKLLQLSATSLPRDNVFADNTTTDDVQCCDSRDIVPAAKRCCYESSLPAADAKQVATSSCVAVTRGKSSLLSGLRDEDNLLRVMNDICDLVDSVSDWLNLPTAFTARLQNLLLRRKALREAIGPSACSRLNLSHSPSIARYPSLSHMSARRDADKATASFNVSTPLSGQSPNLSKSTQRTTVSQSISTPRTTTASRSSSTPRTAASPLKCTPEPATVPLCGESFFSDTSVLTSTRRRAVTALATLRRKDAGLPPPTGISSGTPLLGKAGKPVSFNHELFERNVCCPMVKFTKHAGSSSVAREQQNVQKRSATKSKSVKQLKKM